MCSGRRAFMIVNTSSETRLSNSITGSPRTAKWLVKSSRIREFAHSSFNSENSYMYPPVEN